MKILIAIVLSLSLMACNRNRESIVPIDPSIHEGNLEIRSLTDLNDPAIAKYKTINGTLQIHYTDEIIDLNQLSNLEHINGGILIHYNDGLKSLKGLEKLKSVEFLEIKSNLELTSLDGLNNLMKVTDKFSLEENYKLSSVDVLSNLNEAGNVFISSCSISNLNGLNNLHTVSEIILYNNPNMSNLNGLEGIMAIDKFMIGVNKSLDNYCAIQNIIKTSSSSIIFDARANKYNPSLADLMNDGCSK